MIFLADHIYVINRPDREDRKEHAISQIDKLAPKPDYTVWPAVMPEKERVRFRPDTTVNDWNRFSAALCKSTIQVLEDAKERGYDRIMICEDDVMFTQDAVKRAKELVKGLDKTVYDLFHLGHLAKKKPIQMGNGLVKLQGSLYCHCYVINSRIFDDMIHHLKKMDRPLDHITMEVFHPSGRCYAAEPALATQKPDYSNIQGKHVNHNIK